MTTGRGSLPFQLIAALLLLVIALRGWTLFDLMDSQRELESLEEVDDSALPAKLLDQIDALERKNLSGNQLDRLQSLRKIASRSAAISAFSLIWPDGSQLPLREAIRYPIGGASGADAIALVFDKKALGDRLLACAIDGVPHGLEHAGWALPLRLGTKIPNQVIEIRLKLSGELEFPFQLSFLLDRNSPQLSLSSPLRSEILPEDGVVGLKDAEDLQLKIQDGTLMRRVRVSLDEEKVLDRAYERAIDFKIAASQDRRVRTLSVEAVDWAGNVLESKLELRPFEAPAPRLVSAKLGELDLLAGPQRWRERTGKLQIQLEGDLKTATLSAEFDQAASSAFQPTDGTGSQLASFSFSEDSNQLAGRISLQRYGKSVTLAQFNLVHDASRPQIELYDAHGAQVLVDAVAIHEGQSYRLEVRDNDVLDAHQEVARIEGGIRLDAPKRERQVYTQQVHVADTGKLIVVARDLAGNESRREVNFTLMAKLGPDDEKGPEVALYSGSTRLDPQQNLLFWENSGELELRVSDSSGVDPKSLKLERLTSLSRREERTSASWSLKVEAKADPSVEVADRFGRKSRVFWPIVILSGPAEIKLSDDSEKILEFPAQFEWRMQDVAPDSSIRCRLIGPDEKAILLSYEGSGGRGSGEIPKLAVTSSGHYRLTLELQTPKGHQEIASKSIEVDI